MTSTGVSQRHAVEPEITHLHGAIYCCNPDPEEVDYHRHVYETLFRNHYCNQLTPDGSLYRGFATGLHGSPPVRSFTPGLFFKSPSKMALLTVALISSVQGFAPACIAYWAAHESEKHEIVNLWSKMFNDRNLNRGDVGVDTHGKEVSGYRVWEEYREYITKKIGGCALLILLFLHGDNMLSRMDVQSDRLKALMPEVSAFWMRMDAFFHMLAVGGTAAVSFMLFLTAPNIKELILDAFALLFIQGLALYGGDLYLDVRPYEFAEWLNDPEQQQVREQERVDGLRAQKEMDDLFSKEPWVLLLKRVHYGDIFYSFGRIINTVMALISVPVFFMYILVPKGEGTKTGPIANVVQKQGYSGIIGQWLIIGSALTCLHIAGLSFYFLIRRYHCIGIIKYWLGCGPQVATTLKYDIWSWVSFVILRHEDPRVQCKLTADPRDDYTWATVTELPPDGSVPACYAWRARHR